MKYLILPVEHEYEGGDYMDMEGVDAFAIPMVMFPHLRTAAADTAASLGELIIATELALTFKAPAILLVECEECEPHITDDTDPLLGFGAVEVSVSPEDKTITFTIASGYSEKWTTMKFEEIENYSGGFDKPLTLSDVWTK